jgi:eukaryotic-like serine/threonine-protein kinase
MGIEKKIVGSSSGAEYVIVEEIGRGGQGRVFSIRGGRYVFKLIGKKTSIKAQLLKRKISYIKTRPIEDLPISIPLEQVDGEALGYIMEMATDMVPIEILTKPDNDFTSWWRQTGGLKKRILILKEIANTLAKLHSRGLVYGDFSLSNIFISKDKNYSNIFFIDSDNITHESTVGTAVYTQGYAAPEIIQNDNHMPKSGYDTFTDDYSFAIIAYQLLTLNHPFIGDYVNEGEPELEEKAYLGEIPWINHRTENINIANSGIPSSFTISKKMMKAFQQTFEQGVLHKTKRVTTAQWSEILSGVFDAIIECENESCQQYFFFPKDLICPFCQNKMTSVGIASICPLLKNMKDDIKYNFSVKLDEIQNIGEVLHRKILTPNQYLILREDDFLLNSSDRELFNLKYKDSAIYIKGVEQKQVSLISNSKYKKAVDISSEIKVNLKGDFILFFNDLNKYQRILKFKKYSV